MKRLKLIILIFNVVNFVSAQNTVHLCVGDSNHNFAVPYTLGSNYIWEVQENPLIATIISGNGTEHITLDLNNIGVFKLKVTETDSNNCTASDSIIVTVHPLPSPNISSVGSVAFCEGDSVRLELDSVYSNILWNNWWSFERIVVLNIYKKNQKDELGL